jgi:hypothetical protein
MDRRHAGILHLAFQPQVEVRRVDADERGRLLAPDLSQQRPADTGQLPITLQRVDVAVNREQFAWPSHIEAFGLHLGAADAEELRIGEVPLDRTDQVARKKIAGSLPGNHGNPYCHDVSGRCRGRSRR